MVKMRRLTPWVAMFSPEVLCRMGARRRRPGHPRLVSADDARVAYHLASCYQDAC